MRLWWNRRPLVVDPMVEMMNDFFRSIDDDRRANLSGVALDYARFFWGARTKRMIDAHKSQDRNFNIGLSVGVTDYAEVTKRVALVADTLLVYDVTPGDFHQFGLQDGKPRFRPVMPSSDAATETLTFPGVPPIAVPRHDHPGLDIGEQFRQWESQHKDYWDTSLGIECCDLEAIGRWIVQYEPLLRIGSVWYLPRYATKKAHVFGDEKRGYKQRGWTPTHTESPIDYLVRDRRAIDISEPNIVKSKVVRPILTMPLPFVDTADPAEFSRITAGEFDAFRPFKYFLQERLLSLDGALSAVQSEVEIEKIAIEIREGVREMDAKMRQSKALRTRTASGAALGTIAATLVAVYGESFQTALTLLGTSVGVWPFLSAMAENGRTKFKDDKWYYVWMLAKSRD